MIAILLFVALITLLLSALPAWPYSKYWGYTPACSMGLVVAIFLVLAVRGLI
jgi:hypothetical protein